jgi:cytochrome c oxidase cbb3-type subunit III
MLAKGLCAQALCAVVWVAGVAGAHGQQSDARAGARRYMEYCAACHGTDARGGAKGPSLAGDPTAGRSDDELYRIVQNGTQGGMPPFAQIGDANIRDLIAYLRLLENSGNTASPQGPPGNPAAGRTLFFGNAQCSACHMIEGQGGFMARSLTHYARNRTADTIRSAIVNPDHPLILSTQVVTVTLHGGQTLTGVLRNEDEFSLALQTTDGRFHLLSRSSVARVDYSGHSLMPHDFATRLSSNELNDIVSFLMSAAKVPQTREGSGQ